MNGQDFLMAELARIAYMEGFADGLSGMEAIAFTLKHRQEKGWEGGDWARILSNYRTTSYRLAPPSEEVPDPRKYSFQQLLQEINGIFSGTRQDDVTVSPNSILKVAPTSLYWARLNEIDSEWFLTEISRNLDHQRIAQVGGLTFFS